MELMSNRLAHRGPDGSGTWLSDDACVGFGHRRLSIIDLSESANQPMMSSRTGLVLTFNGEIYNHREIRRDLVRAGIHFRTDHSDTETLLEAIGLWGMDEALARLVGMFAFALYDPNERCVYLARDRIGIKPLYVTRFGNNVLFASEAKALFVHPDVEARLDPEAFSQYLTFRFVPSPRSLFGGVEKVSAAELWRIPLDGAVARRRTYWNPLAVSIAQGMSRSEAVDALEAVLESSARYRLEADVPVGVFLSGGLDSNLLLQVGRSISETELRTFTIAYPGHAQYDESDLARQFVQAEAGCHYDVSADDASYGTLMGNVAYYQDEPIAAPVCLPVFLLSQAARNAGVPVILTGEGADELFIGYKKWLRLRDIAKWESRIGDLPGRLLRRSLRNIAGVALPRSSRAWDFLDRMAKGQPIFWGGAMDFGKREADRLLGADFKRPQSDDHFESVIAPVLSEFLDARPETDFTGWMTYLDLRYRLPELMLPRLDKMGMAHSIEGRVPFLDHRLVELVFRFPMTLHEAMGNVPKSLLKEVASRRLPKEFVYRAKKGFRAPVAEWKRGEVGRSYVASLKTFSRKTGLFDSTALEQVLRRKNDRLYFSLVNFMLWYSIFIGNPGLDLEAVPS